MKRRPDPTDTEATELPVVVTSSGGADEVVRNHATGLVVPGGDALSLAAALVEVLTDVSLRRAITGAALDCVIASALNAIRSAQQVATIYESLLQGRHRQACDAGSSRGGNLSDEF